MEEKAQRIGQRHHLAWEHWGWCLSTLGYDHPKSLRAAYWVAAWERAKRKHKDGDSRPASELSALELFPID